jgi:L-amino acid N-acyltransferase YncA
MSNGDASIASDAAEAHSGGVELIHLREGSSVTVRATTERDEPALRSFLAGLSLDARHLRFFSAGVDLESAAHLGTATGVDRFSLVAHDQSGTVVGHATYIKMDDHRAEVAVEVADHLHGRGLGTILIERLAAIAEARGVTRFVAQVLPDNREMLRVFSDGFDARWTFRQGVDEVEFPTASWRLARERFADWVAPGGPASVCDREPSMDELSEGSSAGQS